MIGRSALLGLLTMAGCLAQEQTPLPANSGRQTITIPAGTTVSLTLANPIGTTWSRPGDSIHAITSFPVVAGNVVAIPAGTYVDGLIDKVTRPHSRNSPAFQLHFTRLIFPNGSAISLPSATSVAASGAPGAGIPSVATAGQAYQLPSPAPTPTASLPPLPQPKVWIFGAIGGAVVAALVTIAILAHRHGYDVWLDAGSTIKMTLQSPLTLDVDVAGALGASPQERQGLSPVN